MIGQALSDRSCTIPAMTTSLAEVGAPSPSLPQQAAAAQRRWAAAYIQNHRFRHRAGWVLAASAACVLMVTTYLSTVAILIDYGWMHIPVAFSWSSFATALPLAFAHNAAMRSRDGEPVFSYWAIVWLVSLFNGAIGGIGLLASTQVLLAAVHSCAALAVPLILALALAIPLDPSIDWELAMESHLAFVTTRRAPRQAPSDVVGSWRDAEYMAAAWLRRLGYKDARVAASGPDDGIDVNAYGGVAQVKHWSRRATAPEVRKLAGAAKPGQTRFFFSTSGYTQPAIEWASRSDHRVALFHLYIDGNLAAMNAYAKDALWSAPYHVPSAYRRPITVKQKVFMAALLAPGVIGIPIVATAILATSGGRQPHSTLLLGGMWLFSASNIALVFRRDIPRLAMAVRCYVRTRHWPRWRTLILPDFPIDDPDAGLPPDLFVGYDVPRIVHLFRYIDRGLYIVRTLVRVLTSRIRGTKRD
jgi:hypothetical protein